MKKALVIIDMQYGFMRNGVETLVDPIYKYAASNNFDEIIGFRYVNNKNTACYKFGNWKRCMAGTKEAEIIPKLKNICTKIFEKSKYSCYTPEFVDYMKEKGIDTLYLVGVNTECCVLHTAFDAYDALMECRVIENLCGSTGGVEMHNYAIRILKDCITEKRVLMEL